MAAGMRGFEKVRTPESRIARRHRTARRIGLAWMLGAAALSTVPAVAVNETIAYGIAQFGDTNECGDLDDTHGVHDNTSDRFIDHFEDLIDAGVWDEAYERNNTSGRGSYWTDSSKAGDCSCTADDSRGNYGADNVDVAFIHTHGGHVANTNSFLLMGNDSYDCYVYTDDNMFWDDDLDIAIVKACQSGDRGVWLNGGYRQQFTESGSTMTMWNAFHGDSACGSFVKGYVEDYAEDSDFNGVGENWIDEAYDDDNDANEDDCPTSIVFGASSGDREHMYEYGGWRDREDTGDKTGSTIFYVSGCDPSNGTVLP